MREEILKLIREKGLLLEKDLFDLLDACKDVEAAKTLLASFERVSGQKIITISSLSKNFEFVSEIVRDLPGELKQEVERVFVKFGLSLEVKKESSVIDISNIVKKKDEQKNNQDYQIFYSTHNNNKKIEVADFVGHFRSRYQQLQKILMQRPGLDKLTSINKIPVGSRQSMTIIGMVTDKRITKNKNIIITFEDLTGTISALVRSGGESFLQASELQLDDVVAVKCSGDREMVFVHEVLYPDSFLPQKTKFDEEVCVAFISDIHAGSKKHLAGEFQNFLDWLNSNNELAKKIKYIFFVGDNVDGVGVFPGQEGHLSLTDLKEQYDLLASYLMQIPSGITMFMCPGQHDSVRVPEPQPIIDDKYGAALYNVTNLTLVSNPSLIKLKEGEKEFKVFMYHGASIHTLINSIDELRLIKAHTCPAKAVKHMLKRRHIAPTHSSVVYVPNAEKDPLVISEVPDVFCTGEVHRLDIERYNGTLIVTGSCWQAQTDYEEKVGNIPDPCKVPILNLKTHELKILDFGEESLE